MLRHQHSAVTTPPPARLARPLAWLVAAGLLLAGCGYGDDMEPAPVTTTPPLSPSPSSTTSINDIDEPETGDAQGMPNERYVRVLRAQVPWTSEIGDEIIVSAGRINCIAHLDGGRRKASRDASEQGFEGADANAFIHLSAHAYCPSVLWGEDDTVQSTVEAGEPGEWDVELSWQFSPSLDGYEVRFRAGSNEPDVLPLEWEVFEAEPNTSGFTLTAESHMDWVEYELRPVLASGPGWWRGLTRVENPL